MKIKKEGFAVDKPLQQKIFVDLDTANGTLQLELDPLPIGFYERIEKLIPSPRPPKIGWVRDRKGRFARDDMGNLIPEYDEDNAEYLEAKSIAERRQNTAQIYEVLKTSEDIEFDADEEEFTGQNGNGKTAFYDAIYDELVNAGMSFGQQVRIIRTINKTSGLSEEDIEDYKKN